MTLKLLKIKADDSWFAEAEPTVPRQVSARQPAALAPSGGFPPPDRGRALEKARELVDQAYAVPDGGWVEGGGLWTVDRMGRQR